MTPSLHKPTQHPRVLADECSQRFCRDTQLTTAMILVSFRCSPYTLRDITRANQLRRVRKERAEADMTSVTTNHHRREHTSPVVFSVDGAALLSPNDALRKTSKGTPHSCFLSDTRRQNEPGAAVHKSCSLNASAVTDIHQEEHGVLQKGPLEKPRVHVRASVASCGTRNSPSRRTTCSTTTLSPQMVSRWAFPGRPSRPTSRLHSHAKDR